MSRLSERIEWPLLGKSCVECDGKAANGRVRSALSQPERNFISHVKYRAILVADSFLEDKQNLWTNTAPFGLVECPIDDIIPLGPGLVEASIKI